MRNEQIRTALRAVLVVFNHIKFSVFLREG